MAEHLAEIERIASDPAAPNFENTFAALERSGRTLDRVGAVYNVFSSTEGFRFNMKRQPPGASAGVPFMTRGTAQIRCVIHPGMKLTVVVE